MAPHLYWTAENTAGKTVTNTTTPQAVVTLAVPVESGKTYAVLGLASTDDAYITAPHSFDLYDDTGSAQLDAASEVCQTTGNSEVSTGTMLGIFVAAATETRTFKLRATAANATGLLAKGRITVLRLEAGDKYVQQLTEQNTSSTSYGAVATLAFTPSASTDYVVLSNFVYRNDSGSSRYECDFYDGSTSYSQANGVYAFPSGKYKGSSLVTVLTGRSGAQSWSFRHRSLVSGNNVRTRTCTILALAVQSGQDMQSSYLTAPFPTTSSSFTEGTGITATFNASPYLLLASVTWGMSVANNPIDLRMASAGSALGLATRRSTPVSGYLFPYAFSGVVTHSGSSETDELDFASVNGSTTATLTFRSIVALELTTPTTGSGVEIVLPAVAATAVVNAPAVGGGAAVQVPAVTASAVANAPAVAGGAAVVLPAVTAAAVLFAPTVGLPEGVEIVLPVVSAAATLSAPTLATGVNVVLPVLTALATPNAPAVTGGTVVVVPVTSSARPLTDGMATAIIAGEVRPALLLEAEFADGTVRMWTGIGTLTWNSVAWTGGGTLLGVSQISEGEALEATTTTVTLSSISEEIIAYALAQSQTGGVGRMYLALFDTGMAIVADPYVIFQGRLSVPTLNDDGKSATLSISYDSLLADLFRTRTLRYTDAQQKALFPGDRGMEFATAMANWDGRWGPKGP